MFSLCGFPSTVQTHAGRLIFNCTEAKMKENGHINLKKRCQTMTHIEKPPQPISFAHTVISETYNTDPFFHFPQHEELTYLMMSSSR